MANGTDTLDEEQGQDFRLPDAAAPVVAPTAMPQPRPMVVPSGPPSSINPQWSGAERLANVQAMGNAETMAQAERAVKAAQLFQAQRGYQRDVAGGMSAVQAGAKWGPSLFGATPAGASATARMAAAAQPQSKVFRGPGGQLFRVGGTGQAEAISPPIGPKVVPPVTAVKQIPGNEAAIRKLENVAPQMPGATTLPDDVFNAPFTPEGDVLRQRNAEIRQQVRPPVTPPRAGPASQAPPTAVPPIAAAAPRAALPFPKSKKEAVKGSVYQTRHGPMLWNGEQFVTP